MIHQHTLSYHLLLYRRYVLPSKLNVTPRKSTSVMLVTNSVLESIFLKIMIISFRTLSVRCLIIFKI